MADPFFGLRPISLLVDPGGANWVLVGGTSQEEILSDDDDASYLRGNAVSIQPHTYGIEALAPPPGATVTKVQVKIRAQRVSGGTITLTCRLELEDGTLSVNKSKAVGAGGIKDHFFDFTNSRPGGGLWTVADFVELKARLSYSGGTAPVQFRVMEYRVEVSLDPTTFPTPIVISGTTASDVTSSSARLEAVVNPNGFTSQYPLLWTFNYNFPNTEISPDPPEGIVGTTAVTVSTQLLGLINNNTYISQLKLDEGDGTFSFVGAIAVFTTLSNDAPMMIL